MRLLLAVGVAIVSAPAPISLGPFTRLLQDTFEEQSRVALVQKEIEKISDRIDVKLENADEALEKATQGLHLLFQKRISALRKLLKVSEEAVREVRQEPQPFDNNCTQEYAMNASDVHNISAIRNGQTGSHINIESYRCDPNVTRDFDWTGMDMIERTMQRNHKESGGTLLNQFIGTYSGVTRMFPWRQWVLEPPEYTVDLFDPKFRPWFTNAESPPKDIVFLIDHSGSMKGPTMHLTRITLLYILSTLNPNDYFTGVWFTHDFGRILECDQGNKNETFIPATTRNKKVFYRKLVELEEKDQAVLGPPLNYSLEILREKADEGTFGLFRSEAHKMIILMTDGIDEWPHAVIEEELETRDKELIRVFGFAMGFGTGPLPLLEKIACASNASYALVDSISDVKLQSRAYLNHLSNIHAHTLLDVPIEKRPLSWSPMYMETQGQGPVITISSPIVVPDNLELWNNQSDMAGIAGLDIHIKELGEHLPHGDQLRGFIVDNNGIVVFHHKHVLPKTETHSVRRSACYDARAVRSKVGSGRVQYAQSDQRVYRLVGLIDSIPTIDLYELERNSTGVKDLRTAIATRNCSGEPIDDKEHGTIFRCQHIPNTPYTVVISDSSHRKTLRYNGMDEPLQVEENMMVHFYLAKREICNYQLDKFDAVERFREWANLTAEHEHNCRFSKGTLTKPLANALAKWADSWPVPDHVNATCENAEPLFDPEHYISSFVYTHGQVLASYPQCKWVKYKDDIKRLNMERLTRDHSTDIQFTVADNKMDRITVFRPIHDIRGIRLAIVGVHWKPHYISHVFREYRRKHRDTRNSCETKACMIVTQSGFVVASSLNRPLDHLSIFDPQLYITMEKEKIIRSVTEIDSQAECEGKEGNLWSSSSSSSPSAIGLFRYVSTLIVDLLSYSFWVDLYLLISSSAQRVSAQPKEINKTSCVFHPEKKVERCSVVHVKDRLNLDVTGQINLNDDAACYRHANMHHLSGMSMVLIVVDKPCSRYRAKKKFEPRWRRMSGCEIISNYPSAPLDYNFTLTSPVDRYAECVRSSVSPLIPSAFLLFLFTFLLCL